MYETGVWPQILSFQRCSIYACSGERLPTSYFTLYTWLELVSGMTMQYNLIKRLIIYLIFITVKSIFFQSLIMVHLSSYSFCECKTKTDFGILNRMKRHNSMISRVIQWYRAFYFVESMLWYYFLPYDCPYLPLIIKFMIRHKL